MGRIVKGAKLGQSHYVVAVPVFVPELPPTNGQHVSDGDFEVYQATPPPEPEPVAPDWLAVRAEAATLVERAGLDAKALIEDAQQRSIELISEAASLAQEIEDEARAAGHELGVADGQAAAAAEVDDMLTSMRGLIAMARAERHKIIEQAEPEIVRLSMMIAERVVHQHIAIDRNAVVAMAKAAISRIVNRETVTVRVNPADIESIREHRDGMVALNDIAHLRVIEDQRVDRGGVVVETEAGSIDAKVGTQLREARRALHVEEEPIPLEPSTEDILLGEPAQAS